MLTLLFVFGEAILCFKLSDEPNAVRRGDMQGPDAPEHLVIKTSQKSLEKEEEQMVVDPETTLEEASKDWTQDCLKLALRQMV